MAENKRKNEVKKQEIINNYLYYDEYKETPLLHGEKQDVILDYSLGIEEKMGADDAISTIECVIILGDIKDGEIAAGESVIVNNVYSSRIESDKDIFILGECIDSVITAKGKVIILKDLSVGTITGKQVSVIGKQRNNPEIYEIK